MSQDDQRIRVVAISGSLRPGSYTRMALDIVLRGAQELGAEIQLIDLNDYNLIFCDSRDDYPAGHQAGGWDYLRNSGVSWRVQRCAQKRPGLDGFRAV